MSKPRKSFLIFLLLAVLLFAAGAYILIFRSGATVDFYASKGAEAMSAGRYSRAVRYYQSAIELDDSLPQLHISLAEAYKGTGNYTKAEYTLVSAITNCPEETSLYVALSHAYVEQEKFLDADLMLSRAANDRVKAELDAMRPAPPTLTPDSGYYSNYISVSAFCSAGRIFLTVDGQYPANENDLYTEPVMLPAGETTVCALVVDDSGLVSPAVYAGYTVAGIIEPVTVTDPALDALLRQSIGKGAEEQLMTNELWAIEELELTGPISDLSQLSLLTGLKTLKITGIPASDFSAIANLPKLTELDLSGCVLSAKTMEAVGKLTQLTSLNLSGCALRNVDMLANLIKLKDLDLSNNVISDITPLALLRDLNVLNLRNNPVSSIAALSACSELTVLDAASCELSNLQPLSGKTALQELYLSDNAISSLEPLADCIGLQKLDVSSNKVADISILPGLPALTMFDGSYNKIGSIPTFAVEHPLHSINLNYNSISDVSGLKDMMELNYVMLDYNDVEDISPLANCYNLVQVDVWDNPVTKAGVNALQAHSIIVNYIPDL